MKNKIKILIGICIIIIVVIIISMAILMSMNSSTQQAEEDNIFDDIDEINIGTYKVQNRQDYYTAASCVDTYLSYVTNQDKEVLYDLLDTVYKQKYGITKQNVLDFVDKIDKIQVFTPSNMYVKQAEAYLLTFYIEGTIREENELQRQPEQEFRMIVRVNTQEKAFSILPYSYIQEKKIGEISQIEDSYIQNKEIKLNENNEYLDIQIDDKIMANLYFMDYKDKALYDADKAYEQLEETYRTKRFGTLENYKNYIKETVNELETLTVSQYIFNEYDNYNEYVCKDKYGNLYIFKENAIMDYTLMLDTYTIEQSKFTQEYQNANTQKKVMLNIDKFIQMLNAKDYRNSYLLLSSSFRNKYFKTQQEYETYMKQNLFRYNEVSYSGYETYNDIYTYKLTIKDKTKQSEAVKELNINMKLGEGTNFELSFNV